MDTMKGSARLAAQDGGTGYFASVELEAEIHEGEYSLTIEFEAQGAEQWMEAAIVGVRTAWKHLPSKLSHERRAVVRITNIDWQPGDTTDIIVVYTCANAVFNLFDVSPRKKPEFVQAFGVFVFDR